MPATGTGSRIAYGARPIKPKRLIRCRAIVLRAQMLKSRSKTRRYKTAWTTGLAAASVPGTFDAPGAARHFHMAVPQDGLLPLSRRGGYTAALEMGMMRDSSL
jgi:hypothetical protein